MNRALSLIPEYVLGTLPEDERRELEALILASPAVKREVDEAAEALARVADLTPRVRPTPGARARLLETLGGVDRFAPFFDDLTRLFELPLASLRRLLARVDTGPWETTLMGVPLPNAELFHFQVGPRLAAGGAAGGVVRVRAGATFPRHAHHGDELTYVLEGGYRGDGRVLGPGSTIEATSGTEHTYTAAPERDLVLAVLHRGIALIGASAP